MRWKKLDTTDVYSLLSKKYDDELSDIRKQLSNTVDKNLFNHDHIQINDKFSSLQFDLDNALTNTEGALHDSVRELQAKITAKVDEINVTDNVNQAQDNISELQSDVLTLLRELSTEEESDKTSTAFEKEILEKLEDRLNELEKLVQRAAAAPYIAQGIPTGNTPAGTQLEIQSEGNTVTDNAECINFTGDEVTVTPDPTDPTCVTVDITATAGDSNTIRRSYQDETQLVFYDIPNYPLVQNYEDAEIDSPALYNELDTMLYGNPIYNQQTVAGKRMTSHEQATPEYLVEYIASYQQAIITFGAPKTGTVVLTY